MKLTEAEREICRKYGAFDDNMKVHCSECPLAIDHKQFLCKGNCKPEEWEEYLKEKRDGGEEKTDAGRLHSEV